MGGPSSRGGYALRGREEVHPGRGGHGRMRSVFPEQERIFVIRGRSVAPSLEVPKVEVERRPHNDSTYWSWVSLGNVRGHVLSWRPSNSLYVSTSRARMTIYVDWDPTVSGSVGPYGATGRRGAIGLQVGRKWDAEVRKCILGAPTALLPSVNKAYSGYCPFYIEVKCPSCGAGAIIDTEYSKARRTIREHVDRALSAFLKGWDERVWPDVDCEGLRRDAEALAVMNS